MRKFALINVLSFTLVFLFPSCCKKHHDALKNTGKETTTQAGPPVYIYKTRADYSKYVPVILSPDKKSVISYPGVNDVTYKGELAYPTLLANGYLLDNRGISKDVAFLNISYEAFRNMKSTPAPEELYNKILDKDPLTELYYCGSRFQYKDLVAELNALIQQGNFSKFTKEK